MIIFRPVSPTSPCGPPMMNLPDVATVCMLSGPVSSTPLHSCSLGWRGVLLEMTLVFTSVAQWGHLPSTSIRWSPASCLQAATTRVRRSCAPQSRSFQGSWPWSASVAWYPQFRHWHTQNHDALVTSAQRTCYIVNYIVHPRAACDVWALHVDAHEHLAGLVCQVLAVNIRGVIHPRVDADSRNYPRITLS
jgi:hypothetical protein